MSLHAPTGLRNRVSAASKQFASTRIEESTEQNYVKNPSPLHSDKCFRFSESESNSGKQANQFTLAGPQGGCSC